MWAHALHSQCMPARARGVSDAVTWEIVARAGGHVRRTWMQAVPPLDFVDFLEAYEALRHHGGKQVLELENRVDGSESLARHPHVVVVLVHGPRVPAPPRAHGE